MLCKVNICSLLFALYIGAGNARVFLRQADAVSADGLSTLPAETPGLQNSPTGTVSGDGSSTAPSETPGLQTTTSDAVSVDGPVSTLPPESPGLQTQAVASSSASGSTNGGAIAGGVVGAVAVAAIAAVLLLRYRNKRSPRHWRNRIRRGGAGPLGDRWHNLDLKSDAGGPGIHSTYPDPVVDDHKSPISSPVSAKSAAPFIYPPDSFRPNETIEMQNRRSTD